MDCSDLITKLPELIKYLVQNMLWVFIGFGFGIAVYWWRIGQFKNEFKSLFYLFKKKYNRGDEFILNAGVDVKSLDGSETKFVTSEVVMVFGYERGVDWFFCSLKGLIRSRVIYASFRDDTNANPKYFIISHTYIKS